MIASSLKEEDGLVDLLLSKGADATIQNNGGQVGNEGPIKFRLLFGQSYAKS